MCCFLLELKRKKGIESDDCVAVAFQQCLLVVSSFMRHNAIPCAENAF